MTTFTIDIGNEEEADRLREFLKGLKSAVVNAEKANSAHPASVASVEEFQERIKIAQTSISAGKVYSNEAHKERMKKWKSKYGS